MALPKINKAFLAYGAKQADDAAKKGGPSREELQELATTREQQLAAVGGSGIEQDSPGAFARVIDVLSRPNYALAGAFEELAGKGEDDLNFVSRFFNELFSGLPGLKGKKRGFGEVLERAGVDTIKLGEVIPILDNTIVGNIVNTRGAVGLALDIFTDPLTYLGSGAFKTGFKVTFGDEVLKTSRSVVDEATGKLIRGEKRVETGIDKLGEVSLTKEGLDLRNKGLATLKKDLGKVLEGARKGRLHEDLPEYLMDSAETMVRRREAIIADPTIGLTQKVKMVKKADSEFKKALETLTAPTKTRAKQSIELSGASRKEAQAAIDAIEEEANRLFLRSEEVATGWGGNAFDEVTGLVKGVPSKFVAEAGIRWGLRGEARSVMLIRKAFVDKYVGPKIEDAMVKFLGDKAHTIMNASVHFGRGAERAVKGTFSSLNKLSHMSHAARAIADPIVRKATRDRTLLNGRVMGFVMNGQKELGVNENLMGRIIDMQKKDENFGENLHRYARLAKGEVGDLTPEQVVIADEYLSVMRSMGHDLVAHGVMEKEQLAKLLTLEGGGARNGYVTSIYKNIDQVQEYYRVRDGGKKWSGNPYEPFAESRVFGEIDDSIELSAAAHRIGKENARIDKNQGFGALEYPELVHDFDIARAFSDYSRRYSDAITKVHMGRDMRKAFGKEFLSAAGRENISNFETFGNRVYDMGRMGLPDNVSPFMGGGKVHPSKLPHLASRTSQTPAFQSALREFDAMRESLIDLLAHKNPQKAIAFLERNQGSESVNEFYRRLLVASANGDEFADGYIKTFYEQGLTPARMKGVITEGSEDLTLKKYYGERSEWGARSGGIWGSDGSGIMIPEVIANSVEGLGEAAFRGPKSGAIRKLIDGFDLWTSSFRFGVYTIWPASAFRDLYSNVANSALQIGVSAFNPRLMRDTMKVMAAHRIAKGQGGVYKKMFGEDVGSQIIKTRDGREVAVGVLMQEMEQAGTLQLGRDLAEVGLTRSISGDVRAFKKGKVRKGGEYVLDTRADIIDNQSRVMLALANMDEGLTVREATARVNEFLFDYQTGLSANEKGLLRRLIPFYSFLRFETELAAKSIIRDPGRLINQIKPVRGRQSENEYMAKWEAEGLKLRLGGDGKTVRMLNGIDLPMRNIDTFWRGSTSKTVMGFLGQVNPLLKVPVEAATGVDFFTGAPLVRSRNPAIGRMFEPLPKVMRDWFGYKKEVDEAGRAEYSFHGTKMKLFSNATLLSRVVTTSDRAFREYVGQDTPGNMGLMVDLLTGMRSKELNLDDQRKRVLRRRIRQMEEAIVKQGGAREFTQRFGFDDNLEGLR